MATAVTNTQGDDGSVRPPTLNAGGGPTRTRIRLRPNWDATLAYDLLDTDTVDGSTVDPVFVGRTDLLGSMVNAISQTDRRGTYLVSGYRGVGKTSLVIEAARQARSRLPAGWQLLPLVLNVSEVSASLESAADVEVKPLHIDARKLLTALLRELRNSMDRVSRFTVAGANRSNDEERVQGTVSDLSNKVLRTYRKAEAAHYQEKEQARAEETRTAATERRRSFEMANVLTLVGALTALTAVALQGIVLLGTVAGAIEAIVVALGAGAILSFARARTLTRTTTELGVTDIEIVLDNSLHQLESDLKDILADLHRLHWRTVIVLEELDKVDDEQGGQLEAVIRYFKNLFTQAPALFFFLTDKQYFDHVSSRIAKARREQTYAIEHTFFTHRLFIKRPSVEDCLAYLRAVFADKDDQRAIDELIRVDQLRVRAIASMKDERERFIRVLLFRAQDHLFDLKNEMRRYVQVGASDSVLEFDEVSLPPAEQALAAFQFLLEQKTRSFHLGGGRDYGNEVLRSSLSSVFSGLGSSTEQQIADFLPRDDQLAFDEQRRVEEAVGSLVDDLDRGGALEVLSSSGVATGSLTSPTAFKWRENAAVVFAPVAHLAPHEDELAAELGRLARVVSLVTPGGPLAGVIAPSGAHDVAAELLRSERECRASELAMSKEAADLIRVEAERDSVAVVEAINKGHLARLRERYDLILEPVSGTRAPTVWGLRPSPEHALVPTELKSAPYYKVFLVYGSGNMQREALVRLADSSVAGDPRRDIRVAAVVVEDDPAASGNPTSRASAWQAAVNGTPWEGRLTVALVPLDEGLQRRQVDERWGERTADELTFALLWVAQADLFDRRKPLSLPGPQEPYSLRTSDGLEMAFDEVSGAVRRWVESGDQLLVITEHAGVNLDLIAEAIARSQDPGTIPIAFLLLSSLNKAFPSGVRESRSAGYELEAIRRLVAAGKIVLGVGRHGDEELRHAAIPVGTARLVVDASRSMSGSRQARTATLRASSSRRALGSLATALRGYDDEQAEALQSQVESLDRVAAGQGDVYAMASLTVALRERDSEASLRWQDQLVERAGPSDGDLLYQVAMDLGGAATDRGLAILNAAAQVGNTDAMMRLLIDVATSNREASLKWLEPLLRSSPHSALVAASEVEASNPGLAGTIYRRLAERGDVQAAGRLVVLQASDDPDEAAQWQRQFEQLADASELRELADAVAPIDRERSEALLALARRKDQESTG